MEGVEKTEKEDEEEVEEDLSLLDHLLTVSF